jgi:hypothetical protein
MTYITADDSTDGVAKVLYESILKHLDLWDVKRKPPARANPPEADLKPLSIMMNPHRPARMIT